MLKNLKGVLLMGILLMATSGVCLADQGRIEIRSKALAHYMMGVMDDLNGDNKLAVSEYQKSLKFDPHQPMAQLRLGSHYFRTGQINQAIKQLKSVLKDQPNSVEAHYLLALIYSSQKKYLLATQEYESILKHASVDNPQNTEIYLYLAQLYYSLHQYSQATQQLQMILLYQPKNVSALFLLGSIQFDLHELDKAKEYYRQVLSLEPDHEETLNSLAFLYAEQGVNLEEALKMARRVVDLDSSNGAYLDTLGWVLFKKELYSEALIVLEKAQQYVTDPIVYEHIGDVYKAMNNLAMARTSWLKSLSLNSNQPLLSKKIEQLNKTSVKLQSSENSVIK